MWLNVCFFPPLTWRKPTGSQPASIEVTTKFGSLASWVKMGGATPAQNGISRKTCWHADMLTCFSACEHRVDTLQRKKLIGGFNPSEKYARQIGFIFPNFPGENEKNIETTTYIEKVYTLTFCFVSASFCIVFTESSRVSWLDSKIANFIWKLGKHRKQEGFPKRSPSSSSNHPFSGFNLPLSFREWIVHWSHRLKSPWKSNKMLTGNNSSSRARSGCCNTSWYSLPGKQ